MPERLNGGVAPPTLCAADREPLGAALRESDAGRDAELEPALQRISEVHPRYGHRFAWALKALTVVDESTRECLAIEVRPSIGAGDRVLEQLFAEYGSPPVLRSDNTPSSASVASAEFFPLWNNLEYPIRGD